MTEPLDPNAGHLDLETLADLDEGLLDPQQSEAVRAHLAECAQCRDDLASLTSVRELLAADARDASLPMPDDIAERLHAALAAEPPLTPPADEPAGPAADAPGAEPYAPVVVTTLPQRPADHRRRNQWLGGLAAAAVIALFALGISVLPHSSGSSSTAGSAASTSSAPVTATSSGRDYTHAGLGTQALALIGRAPASSAAAGGSSSAAAATSAAATSAAASAPALSTSAGSSAAASSAPASSAASSALASAAASGGKSPAGNGSHETSAGATSAAPSSVAATPTADSLAALRRPGAAQACLSSYDSQAGAPLAIDFATFDGRPAVIGVFNDPNHPGQFEVVAVGPPGCSLYEFARPNLP